MMMSKERIKKYLIIIFNYNFFLIFNVFVFLLKILYSYKQKFFTNTFEDWNIANNIVYHQQYSQYLNLGSTAYKLPIYPFFLSIFIYLFGEHAKESVILFQHLLYFFIPIFIIKISIEMGIKEVGVLTGYAFLLSPAYFFYSNILEATNIFIPLFLCFLYYYVKLWNKKISTKNLICITILLSVIALTQVVAIPLMLCMLFFLWFYKRLNFRNLILVFGFSALLYSPWIIRNYLTFNTLIISKTPVWQNQYMGYVEDSQVFKNLKVISHKKNLEVIEFQQNNNEFKMEKFYRKTVKDIEKTHPYIFFKKALSNAFLLWYVPARYYKDNSYKILFGRKIYVSILNVLTFLSLMYLYQQKKIILFWFSILLFLNFTIPYMIGHAANTRFKLDFEWYQLFLVSYFLFFKFINKDYKKRFTSVKI